MKRFIAAAILGLTVVATVSTSASVFQCPPNPAANDPTLQNRLIDICAEISGIVLPG